MARRATSDERRATSDTIYLLSDTRRTVYIERRTTPRLYQTRRVSYFLYKIDRRTTLVVLRYSLVVRYLKYQCPLNYFV